LIKKFARRIVMSGSVTNIVIDPYFPSTQRGTRETTTPRTATGSREKKMKKTILTIAGSALIALSTVQFAAASEQQDRAHHRAHASAQFRDTNAYAAPAQQEWSGYSYGGGISAPAGR
jgi:hypothetical protein